MYLSEMTPTMGCTKKPEIGPAVERMIPTIELDICAQDTPNHKMN